MVGGFGVCGDCLASEGEIHEMGCDMEKCTICKRQFICCEHFGKLKDEEREPYFEELFSCVRCGAKNCDMKMVSNEEWKVIVGATYDTECILCRECMSFISEKRREKKDGNML